MRPWRSFTGWGVVTSPLQGHFSFSCCSVLSILYQPCPQKWAKTVPRDGWNQWHSSIGHLLCAQHWVSPETEWRWGRIDCHPQGAPHLYRFPRTAFTNCHKLRGLHNTTIWSYRCTGQKPNGGFYHANTEVLAGPCSFLEAWGKNPFCCSCMVLAEFSFFFLLFGLRYNWHTTVSKFKVYSVLTRYTYVFQCDDHHSLELTPPSHHIITISFLWWEHSGLIFSNFRVYNMVLFIILTVH